MSAAVTQPWAAGYSGCPGVTASGTQFGSATVAGLPSGSEYAAGHFRKTPMLDFIFYKPGENKFSVRSVEEKSGGTYIQVEAIELSRTVPFALAWFVNPIIRNVPKTFLSHLLSATRKAVTAKSTPRINASALKTATDLNLATVFPPGLREYRDR